MKNVSLISYLAMTICAASIQRAGAQQAGSASMTRWHPPTLDVTKDDQPKAIPLVNVLESVKMSTDPYEVYLNTLTGFELSVHNGTDRPLVVDADKCTALLDGVAYDSAGSEQIDHAVRYPHTLKTRVELKTARIAIAAVTIGAYQTVTDALVQRGPVLKRYGVDEVRREEEEIAFGSRVVWPGETSKGLVYFSVENSLRGAALKIPVRALFDPTDQATVQFTF